MNQDSNDKPQSRPLTSLDIKIGVYTGDGDQPEPRKIPRIPRPERKQPGPPGKSRRKA